MHPTVFADILNEEYLAFYTAKKTNNSIHSYSHPKTNNPTMSSTSSSSKKCPVVDIHSHLYPPAYIDLLKQRTEIPYITTFPPSTDLRLVNRAGQNGGKPLTPHLYDVAEKLSFMTTHNIDISILSLGNPWLDFLQPSDTTAGEVASAMNDAMEAICASAHGRLFFFAALPFTAPSAVICEEVARVKTLRYARGIVSGTNGVGRGLDDAGMLPIYTALAEAGLPLFLHPNYGIPGEAWGPCCGDFGQVLQVSLGFTMETTIAMTRLILSGVFDKVPGLQVVLPHAGGALPFLAGRIESCILHDRHWLEQGRLDPGRASVFEILKRNVYLDGAVYWQGGVKAAVEASGVERVMFGTDHPFFPPLDGGRVWKSVTSNEEAIRDAFGQGEEYEMIMGGNAVEAFNLR